MVMVDNLINACIELYIKLPKKGKPSANEWTVISAIVAVFNDNNIIVLSLGTGSKCIGKSSMSPKGDVLNDSHAEVIARRAFLKYLYLQIIKLNTTNVSEVLCKDEKNKFFVKDGVKFYFVTGMSPCGDASIIPKTISQVDDSESIGSCLESISSELETNSLKRAHSSEQFVNKKVKIECSNVKEEVQPDFHRTGAKCLPESTIQDLHLPGLLYHKTGAVRTKPGRGDPTLSMSCSDKIARWNAVGWQGALLSLFIEKPIFVEAIICGANVPFSKESFDRAVNERIPRENFVPIHQSSIVFPYVKTEGKKPNPSSCIWCCTDGTDVEVSVNGRKLGVTKKNLHKATARTSICKKELFILFEKAVDSFGATNFLLEQENEKSLKDFTYKEVKMMAKNYQSQWKNVKENYFKVWADKPPHLLDFSLKEEEE